MHIPSIGTRVFVRMRGGDGMEGEIVDFTPTTTILKLDDGSKAILPRGEIRYILIRPEKE